MTPADARFAHQLRQLAAEHARLIADAVADGREPDPSDVECYRGWRDQADALTTTAGDRS